MRNPRESWDESPAGTKGGASHRTPETSRTFARLPTSHPSLRVAAARIDQIAWLSSENQVPARVGDSPTADSS
jgi:hypothetical protein